MIRKRRAMLAWLLLIPVLLTGCFKSETVVKKVDPDPNKGLDKLDGVHYSLPRTVVKAAFPIKRTEQKPGPLEKFAPCFFPADIADERVKDQSTTYSVEEATFAYRVEPDPNEHFVVSVKGGFFEKKSLLLDYVPGGIISKGTAESTNEALDFTLKAIKTGTSIVTGFAGIPRAESASMDDTPINKELSSREDFMTENEKQALNCFRQKYNVAKQKKKESEDALAKAATAEEKKAAQDALAKAVKVEKDAETEKTLIETYLNKEASDRQRAVLPQTTEEDKVRSGGRRGRGKNRPPTRRPQGSAESGGVSNESEGTGPTGNSRQPTDSTTRRSEDNSGTEGSGKQVRALSPRTPDTSPADLTAEKLLDEYQRAQMTFKDIGDLEKRRIELVSGTRGGESFPPETLKEMLSQLDKTLEIRKNLFFGSKAEKPWTANFEYVPEAGEGEIQTSKPLLWFAEEGESRGLCPTPESERQGVIIPKNFRGKKCGSTNVQVPVGMNVIYLYMKTDTEDQSFRTKLQNAQKKFDDQKKKRGWYYRVPAKSDVRLMVKKLAPTMYAAAGGSSLPSPVSGNDRVPEDMGGVQEVRRSVLDIAQLGVTVSVPSSGAGRTNQSTVEYDDFGALKNFKYASDPLLQKSYLDEVQGTAQTIIDAKTKSNEAKKAKTEAEAAAADPLTQKKRELELLETQNKINEERKKLEGEEDEEETP